MPWKKNLRRKNCTSLGVQQLRLCSRFRGLGSILCRGTKITCIAWCAQKIKKKKKKELEPRPHGRSNPPLRELELPCSGGHAMAFLHCLSVPRPGPVLLARMGGVGELVLSLVVLSVGLGGGKWARETSRDG